LNNLKKNDKVLHELRKLDVSEEAKKSLLSQYFNGRADVFEDLAKNYYELFCKEATKKGRPFKEFVVFQLEKLASQGIVTNGAVKSVERHLEGIIEELKRKTEAESRQFLITSDLKEVGSEILAGKPQIEYVEREEIEEVREVRKATDKLLVVGKPGAGKSRFLLRILEDFNGYEKFILIRSFFREDGISSLDAELQKLNSFILIWDDLHRVKKELVNQTIAQVEQLAKDYGKEYMFIGASRMEGEYYQFKPEETKLEDFKSLELIEKCSAYFGVSVGDGIKEKLFGVGDGTPFYVISLFATLKERGKERLKGEDMKALPNDSFNIWHDHLKFLESEGRLSSSEKNVLRSIALAMRAVPTIDFGVLEKFYEKIFQGDLSEFDYALKSIGKKFFIGIEGEFCSMHAVQAEVVEEKYPVEERKIEMLKEVLASLDKERSLKLLWGFAYWFHRNKNYEDCLTFLNGFIDKESNFAVAYNNRGNAYSELNQLETAIKDYNKAIELNPNYAEAYYNRGNAHRKLNQYAKAIEDYSKAIEKNPEFAIAYDNRGVTYGILNRYEDAFKDFEKAIKLNPNYAVVYNNRGLVYAKLNQSERAIEDYNKATELNPNHAPAYNNRGNAYTEVNHYDKAFKDYEKAIELNPNFAVAYNNRGLAYAKLNQSERAIEDYNKAIELNSDYAEAYYNRGNAYVKLNQYGRAIEDYDKAIKLNLDLADAYNNRGAAYADLNQYEQAIEDYDKAIKLNPDDAEAYGNRGLAYLNIGRYEESARDLKNAGLIFFHSGREEDAVKGFFICFELQDKIENDDIVYCGLTLFLITLNPDVIIALRKMQAQDETLRELLELAMRKLHNEDISEEIAVLEREEEREEMNILLERLKRF
jgi:tetratricopeptide (TPR) repeat protein